MKPRENVTLILSTAVVERLLAQKQICVEDFHCADCIAKAKVRKILLNNVRIQVQQSGEH